MKTLLVALTAIVLSVALVAQETGPPTFPAGTEAVLLEMVARDEKGRLVPDLRADEVQVSGRAEYAGHRRFQVETSEEGAQLAGEGSPR